MSILIAGPDPDFNGSAASGWHQMQPVKTQHLNFDVRTISEQLVTEHPLCTRSRLHYPVYEPEPNLRQPASYSTLFKALLWHVMHWDDHEARI
jgi:hypothetical protein